ncbi:hypothetical protein Rsub_11844 [Raphidocelis subcapitata]|uniref:NAD(P)-binding domain-containing protein n=1 Tax=Raphidocelis subcapitata TaxID=307507 RepID=A0A2V0PLX6_9CHLO|nr:hypothetical protein Rsub_11844 [Raphidocelis subcapitata]|eukprot:GBF99073.1 hypothetical protein Rsub_11844 [Raphidocelis subcapitata]
MISQQRVAGGSGRCAAGGRARGAAPLSAARQRTRTVRVRAGVVVPGDTVLVAGATGGVGQIVTAKLLERGYKVRALTRRAGRARELFGDHPNLTPAEGDCRDPASLAAAVAGVDAVCCCTGTTAFPSKRWQGGNGPRETDLEGTGNLIAAAPRSLKRFVFVTSAGVEREGEFPWIVLNAFGVLTFKRQSELALVQSGIPYTLLRPSRLTDGPYTSYDLNTLLKATSGGKREVVLSPNDDLKGQASRIVVAEAAVQALAAAEAEGRAFAIESVEGAGPGEDAAAWAARFAACAPAAAGARR